MTNDVAVRFEFLPNQLRNDLIADIDSSNTRIREFVLGQSATPTCLDAAVAFASERLNLHFNSAILKVYRLTDTRRSGAYKPHRDQPDGATVPIVLCTLRGQADLTFWSETGAQSSLRCVDNMVVMFKPTLLHQVSEPIGPERERYLLTLYFDITAGQHRYDA